MLLAFSDKNGTARDELMNKLRPLIDRFGLQAVFTCWPQEINRFRYFANGEENYLKVLECLNRMEMEGKKIVDPLAAFIRNRNIRFMDAARTPRLMECLVQDWFVHSCIDHSKLPNIVKSGYSTDLYQQQIIDLLNVFLPVSEENRLVLYAVLCRYYPGGSDV